MCTWPGERRDTEQHWSPSTCPASTLLGAEPQPTVGWLWDNSLAAWHCPPAPGHAPLHWWRHNVSPSWHLGVKCGLQQCPEPTPCCPWGQSTRGARVAHDFRRAPLRLRKRALESRLWSVAQGRQMMVVLWSKAIFQHGCPGFGHGRRGHSFCRRKGWMAPSSLHPCSSS